MEFGKIILSLGGKHSVSTVFSDFLEMAICALSLGAKEERYMEVISRYSKAEVKRLSDAFAQLVLEMDDQGNGMKDVLGEFFTLEITRGHNGQYFTPQPVCDLMAEITGDIEPFKRILDPACGSGRTLMAAAKVQRLARFFGADLDQNCARMTAINMCLNGMLGEVAWMNSLSLQFFKAWNIELHPEHRVPYLREISEDESYIAYRQLENDVKPLPKLVKGGGVQLSLFEL